MVQSIQIGEGCQFSRLLAAEVCASAFIVGSNAGHTMFRGSVKSTGYPLHSPVVFTYCTTLTAEERTLR